MALPSASPGTAFIVCLEESQSPAYVSEDCADENDKKIHIVSLYHELVDQISRRADGDLQSPISRNGAKYLIVEIVLVAVIAQVDCRRNSRGCVISRRGRAYSPRR